MNRVGDTIHRFHPANRFSEDDAPRNWKVLFQIMDVE
jgi:hypothetical protein